jgi:hypothetical protein
MYLRLCVTPTLPPWDPPSLVLPSTSDPMWRLLLLPQSYIWALSHAHCRFSLYAAIQTTSLPYGFGKRYHHTSHGIFPVFAIGAPSAPTAASSTAHHLLHLLLITCFIYCSSTATLLHAPAHACTVTALTWRPQKRRSSQLPPRSHAYAPPCRHTLTQDSTQIDAQVPEGMPCRRISSSAHICLELDSDFCLHALPPPPLLP